jgi:hypothetical protein
MPLFAERQSANPKSVLTRSEGMVRLAQSIFQLAFRQMAWTAQLGVRADNFRRFRIDIPTLAKRPAVPQAAIRIPKQNLLANS